MNVLNRALPFLAAALLLSPYYFFYFTSFDQGNADSPIAVTVFKFIALAVCVIAMFPMSIDRTASYAKLLLASFFAWAVVAFIFKGIFNGFSEFYFINTVLCAIPFLLMRPKQGAITQFLSSCAIVLAAQVAIDSWISYSGNSLWDNGAFVGGVGNPSSFGFLCNLLIAYVVFYRKGRFVFLVPVLAYGSVMSSSMLSVAMLAAVLLGALLIRLTVKKLIALLFLPVIAAVAAPSAITDHVAYKLASIAPSDDMESRSISVSGRLDIHAEYANRFSEEPFQALFYGFEHYIGIDSQVLTYISSFGLLISAFFFIAVSIGMASAFKGKGELNRFVAVALLLFAVSFLSNRLLDYFPVAFFLFAVLSMLRPERRAIKLQILTGDLRRTVS
ncbi:MAG: hypothetical protein KKC55_17860 [Gammaproteobacteria bacterium]|nr:hypothetical protein [Gammaproteobacteria bacterium]